MNSEEDDSENFQFVSLKKEETPSAIRANTDVLHYRQTAQPTGPMAQSILAMEAGTKNVTRSSGTGNPRKKRAPIDTGLPPPARSSAVEGFVYKVPQTPHGGYLLPRKPPKTHTEQFNVFRSRILLLLFLQLFVFAGFWLIDRRFYRFPDTLLGTCAFFAVPLLGLAWFALKSFKRRHPFSYLCVLIYNFFILPYFLFIGRAIGPVVVWTAIIHYALFLAIGLILTSAGGCRAIRWWTLVLISIIVSVAFDIAAVEVWQKRCPFIADAIPQTERLLIGHALAFVGIVYVIYATHWPLERYNCYEYDVGFIDVHTGIAATRIGTRRSRSAGILLFLVAAGLIGGALLL